jgi:hypothetical protein
MTKPRLSAIMIAPATPPAEPNHLAPESQNISDLSLLRVVPLRP